MNKKSNKLISLLVTFDDSARKSCRLFLASPYFNKSEDLRRLFDEITRRLDRKDSLAKEAIWKKLWPKKSYNDVRFRKFTSDLFKLLEEFLVQEEMRRSAVDRQRFFLRSISRNKPIKLRESILRNWEKFRNTSLSDLRESSDKYLQFFHLERILYELANYDQRTYDRSNIEVFNEALDVFYISEKLYAYNATNSTAFSRSHDYQINLVQEITKFLHDRPRYLEYLPIAINYYTFLMEAEPDNDQHYQSFQRVLFENTKEFKPKELLQLYQSALNYNTRKINSGKAQYLERYLEVYKHALEYEAVFEDGILDPLQFRNTILFALRLGEFEWTKQYINQYQDRIAEKHRLNAVNFNSATLYFYQKDYDRALDFLRDVEYENITYNLNAKAMLLAIYYETDEFDALDSLYDAILAYLNRHKEIPAHPKKAFRQLVSFTRRLTRLMPGDKTALEKLKTEIQSTHPVASQNWLLEKVAELL